MENNKYTIDHLLNGIIEVLAEEETIVYKMAGIEIPIIQRDYAQGREEVSFIRKRFLDALFYSLEENVSLELDFVYGSIKEESGTDKNIFLPLDGQQRLTTIFLLTWFVANKELELNSNELEAEMSNLSKFTYSTRSSARRFCEKLTEVHVSENVKHSITNSYWYTKSFANDPTVVGMLNTLYDIEERYGKDKKCLFSKLSNICFYILPLDGFDLTDELYIKMNARGKALTVYENFKADMINWMKSPNNPQSEDFTKEVTLGTSSLPWYLSIASKFDNTWTDIFWKKAQLHQNEKNKIVDPYFLRFLKRLFLSEHIISDIERTSKDIENSKEFELLYSDGNEESIVYNSFDEYKSFITVEIIERLEFVLDRYAENHDEINKLLAPSWKKDDDWVLYDSKITQIQRILFLAVCEYLKKGEYNVESFRDWLRVVWNIIGDPDIRTVGHMIAAMKAIKCLAPFSHDIVDALASGTLKGNIESFNGIYKSQIEEECIKASLMSNTEWKESILLAESHTLFQGNIGFLIDVEPSLEKFKKRYVASLFVFSATGENPESLGKHHLYRYCISQFDDWNTIEEFTYINDSIHWKLNLRRNSSVKKSISELLLLDKELLSEVISNGLSAKSSLEDWDNKEMGRTIHQNLYQSQSFVEWTQKADKVSKIKWVDDSVYLLRPRAWYDKVMIDSLRNIVIDEFSRISNISLPCRCNDSKLFYGQDVVINLEYNNVKFELTFSRYDDLFIRTLINDSLLVIFNDSISNDSYENAKKLASQLWESITTYESIDK